MSDRPSMSLPRRFAAAAGVIVIVLGSGCFAVLGIGAIVFALLPLLAGILVVVIARFGRSRTGALLAGVALTGLAGGAFLWAAGGDEYTQVFFQIPSAGVALTGAALLVPSLFRSW